MASKKKDSEVFNLLNLYQDDDDDEDMEDMEKKEEEDDGDRESEPQRREEELRGSNDDEEEGLKLNDEVGVPSAAPAMRLNSNSTPKWSNLRPPTPVQAQSSNSDSDVSWQRREKPSIVDYAHDDVAMSPEVR